MKSKLIFIVLFLVTSLSTYASDGLEQALNLGFNRVKITITKHGIFGDSPVALKTLDLVDCEELIGVSDETRMVYENTPKRSLITGELLEEATGKSIECPVSIHLYGSRVILPIQNQAEFSERCFYSLSTVGFRSSFKPSQTNHIFQVELYKSDFRPIRSTK